MRNNIIIKILASLPIILIMLYFIPFLGICLILLRYFMYDDRKRKSTPIFIVLVGLLILVPKILDVVLDLANVDIASIPYLNGVVTSELYNVEFIEYSKFLICVGVISLILSFFLKTIFDKISSKLNMGVRNYINETQRRNYEISKKNDMEIKIKQEKAKNTSYVKCPKCGSDNILSEKTGICKYCRGVLENKGYKG